MRRGARGFVTPAFQVNRVSMPRQADTGAQWEGAWNLATEWAAETRQAVVIEPVVSMEAAGPRPDSESESASCGSVVTRPPRVAHVSTSPTSNVGRVGRVSRFWWSAPGFRRDRSCVLNGTSRRLMCSKDLLIGVLGRTACPCEGVHQR